MHFFSLLREARKRFESLPLSGADLFNGKFEEFMQAEAKRLKAMEKINLKKPATPASKTPPTKAKEALTIPKCKPLRSSHSGFCNHADNTAGAHSIPQQLPQSGCGLRAPGPPLHQGLVQLTSQTTGGSPSKDP